jgi:hypothetical protein
MSIGSVDAYLLLCPSIHLAHPSSYTMAHWYETQPVMGRRKLQELRSISKMDEEKWKDLWFARSQALRAMSSLPADAPRAIIHRYRLLPRLVDGYQDRKNKATRAKFH